MRKVFLLAVALLLIGLPVQADPLYFKGTLGLFMPNDSTVTYDGDIFETENIGEFKRNKGIMISGAVGYEFASGFAMETEYLFQTSGVKAVKLSDEFATELKGIATANGIDPGLVPSQGDINNTSLTIHSWMFNAIYNHPVNKGFSLYGGGGIGPAWVTGASDLRLDDLQDTVFAYQVMVGGKVRFNDDFALLGGYRYHGTTDASYETELGENSISNDTHSFEMGVQLSF